MSQTGEGVLRLERTGGIARRWDINIRPNFVIGDDTGLADRFTIDTNGNVGIGTTSPSQMLEVSGPSEPKIRVTNTGMAGNPYVTIGMNGGNNAALFETPAGKDFKFRIGAGESLLIRASDGAVGIGMFSPGAKLDVAGRVAIPNFGGGGAYQARKDDASPVDVLMVQNDASFQNATRLRSAGGGVALQNLAGANVMYVAESGAVQVSGQPVINASGQVLYA